MAVHEHDIRVVGAPAGGRLRRRVRTLLVDHRSGPWSRDARVLTVVVTLLMLVGVVMSFSASFVDAAEGGDPFGIFRRQLVWVAIGIPTFVLTAAVDHRRWRRPAWVLMGVAIVGLLAVLVPGVGLTRYGSTRWIGFGPLVVQPSEIAKLASLLWLADVLARKRPRDGGDHELKHLLVPAVPLLGLEAILMMMEPDLGTTILIGLIVGLVLFVEGLPYRVIGAGVAGGGVLVAAAAILEPYRLARITGWLHPNADPLGNGYQLLQSLYALGSGGWFGLGLGSSRGKWNFVPNPETDFIFAIIGEELGLIGALVVVGLFTAMLVVGLRIARKTTDPFGRIVAFGVTGWIVGQAFLNIGTVTGLLPITGVTLPLVSVGGSSLVSTLVALGLLVSISRGTEAAATEERR